MSQLLRLEIIRNACLAVGGWAFVATLGFLASRGPGRFIDWTSPVQVVAAAASVVLTVAGLALWAVMIRRGTVRQEEA